MRPSREELLVETAFVWAKRSTCSRLQVGAVIQRDGRILTQGYNGAPSGMPHCDHECDCNPRQVMSLPDLFHDDECNSQQPCTISMHAEANAIAFAARWGVGLTNSEIVVTHQPCLACAMLIVNSGIRAVTYVLPYRLKDGINLLGEAGLRVEQYLDWEEPRIVELGGDEAQQPSSS